METENTHTKECIEHCRGPHCICPGCFPVNQPTVPDVAKLTDTEIGNAYRTTEPLNPWRRMADAASEKAWLLAWSESFHARDDEVAQLQAQLASFEEWRKHYIELDSITGDLMEERDDAREQVRTLVKMFKRVLPEPYHCHECNSYFIAVDEDECCVTCGAQSQTMPFDAAIAASTLAAPPTTQTSELAPEAPPP